MQSSKIAKDGSADLIVCNVRHNRPKGCSDTSSMEPIQATLTLKVQLRGRAICEMRGKRKFCEKKNEKKKKKKKEMEKERKGKDKKDPKGNKGRYPCHSSSRVPLGSLCGAVKIIIIFERLSAQGAKKKRKREREKGKESR